MSYAYASNIEKGFPLTHYPKNVPKVQDKIVSRSTLANFENVPKIRVSLGTNEVQHAHGDSLMFIQSHLNWFFDSKKIKVIVPKNALTVSFSMNNFFVGQLCQEFYPINRKMPEDAFFTYRMLSKHCQATFYNEGGVQFLAGICYYLQLKDSSILTTQLDKVTMGEAVGSDIPYPLQDRWKSWRFRNYQLYGRDCKTAGKRVRVYLAKGKEPVHRLFNYRTMEYEHKSCAECREEAKTYKFVPVVKKIEEKKKPAPVVTKIVEKPAAVTPKKEESAKIKEEIKPTVEEKLEQLKVKEDELSSEDIDYVIL